MSEFRYPVTTATTIAGLTASRALVSNSSGVLVVSTVTSTELGYVSGVTSALQTQLNAKQATITTGTTAQYLKGDLSLGTLNQAAVAGLTTADSPTFTGMTLSTSASLSGETGYQVGTFTTIGNSLATSALAVTRFGGSAALFLQSAGGTSSSRSARVSGDLTLQVSAYVWEGASWILSARMSSTVDGTVSTGIVPGRWAVDTQSAAGLFREGLRVSSAQIVTIGHATSLGTHVVNGSVSASGDVTAAASFISNAGNTVPVETGWTTGAVQTLGTSFATNAIVSARAAGNPTIRGSRANGTWASKTTVLNNEICANFEGYGYNGSTWVQCAAVTMRSMDTIVSGGAVPGQLELRTANAAGTLTVAVTVDKAQGVALVGTLDVAGAATLASTLAQTINSSDTAVATRTFVTRTHTTSGTAAAGFGMTSLNQLENASGTTKDAASFVTKWITATAAAEDSVYDINVQAAGTLTHVARIGKAGIRLGTAATDYAGETGFSDMAVLAYGDTFSNASVGVLRAGGNGQIGLYACNGTLASKTTIADTNALGDIRWRAWDGTAWQNCARIRPTVAGTVSSGVVPATYSFNLWDTAGVEQTVLQLTSKKNVVLGTTAALATNATDGFVYVPTCAGTPSGAPTAFTGKVAMVYDTTNHKLYIYDGGWKTTTVFA